MLENTFVHIPGVGSTTEKALWDEGCRTWSDLLNGLDTYSTGTVGKETVQQMLNYSVEALAAGRHQFFKSALGMKEAWRAFPEFRHSCCYLDIETDGGKSGDAITTIGMYDGKEFIGLVKGQDLGNFPDIISRYSMIVTFFGAGFDVPMLQKKFRNVKFDQIHIDLCPTLRTIGLRGGLKSIEKQLGISRGDDTDGLNGLDAIRLWNRFERMRDESALEQLIAYNREDVVNLENLAVYAYENLRKRVFPY